MNYYSVPSVGNGKTFIPTNCNYRTEWQRKVIEAEREKRDFLERIEQESQSGRQSAKKLEKVKRDLEKQAADSAQGW